MMKWNQLFTVTNFINVLNAKACTTNKWKNIFNVTIKLFNNTYVRKEKLFKLEKAGDYGMKASHNTLLICHYGGNKNIVNEKDKKLVQSVTKTACWGEIRKSSHHNEGRLKKI